MNMKTNTDTVDLFRGWPNPALLPTTALASAFASFPIPPSALLYAPDAGDPSLRTHIARWLTAFYGPAEPVTPERLCITGGASQNLACILQVFSDPVYTRYVWMVAPTYHLAGRIVEDSGFVGRMRGVPLVSTSTSTATSTSTYGVDVEFLRRELVKAEEEACSEGNTQVRYKPPRPWGKVYKHIIYAVPTFSNPSMVTISRANREDLVRLAREFDALIITDDVYDFLQWSADPTKPLANPDKTSLPRLVDVDRYLDGGPTGDFGNTVSNGSFSKLIGPGVRTGWAEGTEKFAWGLSQVGSSRSGGAPSHLTATMIARLFPTGIFQRFLDNELRPQYAARYYRLMDAIREHLLPLGVTLPTASSITAGGYFVWIQLPPGMCASDLARSPSQAQVEVAAGDLFQVQGDPDPRTDDFSRYLRLCFAWETESNLTEGVRRLAQAVREAQT